MWFMFRRGRVDRTVRALLVHADAQGVEQSSCAALAPAVESMRCRPLFIDLDATLPAGTTARWYALDGADSVAVARGWPTAQRALAHEFGHMLLGHEGVAVSLGEWAPDIDRSAWAWTMNRRRSRVEWDAAEYEAEQFAARLCRELRRRAGYQRAVRPGALADAFG